MDSRQQPLAQFYSTMDSPVVLVLKSSVTITLNGVIQMLAQSSEPDGNRCNLPLKHFDLSMPMLTKLARYEAGIIPIKYRRTLCSKKGWVQFQVEGNPNMTLVLIYNVGGVGDINDVKIKGSSTEWIQMRQPGSELADINQVDCTELVILGECK